MTRTPWANWAGTATATPAAIVRPHDIEETAAAIASARHTGRTVRPLGSGHSFSAIGAPSGPHGTGGIALDLSRWAGIVHADHGTGLVTVRAGTPLHQLNSELADLGLALPNLGDIDRQTLAGALSTGTHGTGAHLGGMATQVHSLELLLADGSIRRCSATENPELFDAARVSLGALGVLSTITLRCVPAFALAADEHPEPLDSVLDRFDDLAETNDHIEFYWFPHGSNTLVKRNNRLPREVEPTPLHPVRDFLEYEVLENRVFGALCRLGRTFPALVRPLTRLSGAMWSSRSYSDRSHRVFVTSRTVRFVESEYAIPRESLTEVIAELRAAVDVLEHPVMFPVEVRVAAADDVWMSTAYRRPTVYVAVHQYAGMPYRHWFDTFESVVRAVGGRPHWGKMHGLGAADLRDLYPRFDDFRRLCTELDPDGVFRNAHLDRVLG
ncbi:L-gulonolactone oxidase [Halopolyspora algeriensis]|uniref:L-gulonolactone oxidase n=1 Tax=Halopolyspora algeriensis TaxID=1500506 RepID=A0A368W234_9ACTN|nr:D-arabinono-1,4-lactone oxidase [Halopolyspora algeriensis]RCW47264.1 L-gulonolactone oxidase [Halopolyspora algeriensis]TQM42500.1 L-gulonolactone oxidase [Halopolyspora algeriensis]